MFSNILKMLFWGYYIFARDCCHLARQVPTPASDTVMRARMNFLLICTDGLKGILCNGTKITAYITQSAQHCGSGETFSWVWPNFARFQLNIAGPPCKSVSDVWSMQRSISHSPHCLIESLSVVSVREWGENIITILESDQANSDERRRLSTRILWV